MKPESSGAAFELSTLFFDGTAGAAVLVKNRNGNRSRKTIRFRDPHAALNHCIKSGITFVFMPGTVKGN